MNGINTNPASFGSQRALSAAAQQFASTSSGDVCRGEPLNNNQFEAAMQRIAGGGPTVQLRAGLIGIDLQILAYRKCAGSASALSAIEGLERQHATALQACKQIAANDNCLVAPF